MRRDGLALVKLRPRHLHCHFVCLRGKAGQLPHFLDHVRRERAEHQHQHLQIALGKPVGVELVDHRHQRRNCRVHLQLVDVLRDLADGLVDDCLVLFAQIFGRACHVH